MCALVPAGLGNERIRGLATSKAIVAHLLLSYASITDTHTNTNTNTNTNDNAITSTNTSPELRSDLLTH